MKKLLFLLLVVFTINTSKASIDSTITDIKETVKEKITSVDTSSTFKQMYSDVKSGISALAYSLKVGAEHVYEIMVKQQIVNSIVIIIIALISLILIINWIKAYKSNESWIKRDDPTIIGGIRIIQIAIGILMFGHFLFNIQDMVMGLVNPEYGAIKDIIDIVKRY